VGERIRLWPNRQRKDGTFVCCAYCLFLAVIYPHGCGSSS
jgi:hypothetical protein